MVAEELFKPCSLCDKFAFIVCIMIVNLEGLNLYGASGYLQILGS